MWEEINDQLHRKFIFKDFASAIKFINEVALLAEKADHHPTITNTYNAVDIWLNTHSAGNIVTEKDHSLAAEISKLV